MDAVSNFPNSLVATAPSPATTGTTLVVTAGQGVLFPAPPFNLVLTAAGAAPSLAASEIVRCTAITTDTLTVTRAQESTTAKTVVAGWQAYATATKNTFSQIPNKAFDAVVATTGGDYTTLGAALAAGASSIYVRRGTFTETTAILNTWTAGSKDLYIVGEDRDYSIIQLFDDTTGYFSIKSNGSLIENLTIKAGVTTGTPNTWISMDASDITLRNVTINHLTTVNYSTALYVNGGSTNCHIEGCKITLAWQGATALAIGNSTIGLVVSSTYFNLAGGNGVQNYLAAGKTWDTVTIRDCYFTGSTANACNAAISLSGGGGSRNVSVINNYITLNSTYAGQYDAIIFNTGTSSVDGMSCLKDNTFNLTGSYRGIQLDYAFGTVVSGNRITRGGSTDNNGIIYCTSNGANNIVSDNFVSYTGASVTGLAGIALQSTSSTAHGNIVKGLNGTTNVGIWVQFGTLCVVYGNTYIACTTNEVAANNAGAPFATRGALALPIRSSTAAVTVYGTDSTILIDTTAAVLTATLPTSIGAAGRVYTLKCIGTNVATIATTATQTIDGAATYSLSAIYKYVVVQSNGANWNVIGNN